MRSLYPPDDFSENGFALLPHLLDREICVQLRDAAEANYVRGGRELQDFVVTIWFEPKLCRAVANLIGTPLHGGSSHVRRMPAAYRTQLEDVLHQDAAYLPPACTRDPQFVQVTAWIPLVSDVGEDRGGLLVVRGSHRDLLPHVVRDVAAADPSRHTTLLAKPVSISKRTLADEAIAAVGDVVALEATIGDVVLLHHNVVHGGSSNLVDRDRWSIDVRYARGADAYQLGFPILPSRRRPSAEELAEAQVRVGALGVLMYRSELVEDLARID